MVSMGILSTWSGTSQSWSRLPHELPSGFTYLQTCFIWLVTCFTCHETCFMSCCASLRDNSFLAMAIISNHSSLTDYLGSHGTGWLSSGLLGNLHSLHNLLWDLWLIPTHSWKVEFYRSLMLVMAFPQHLLHDMHHDLQSGFTIRSSIGSFLGSAI